MMCPHCGRQIEIDPKSPEGLLEHISKIVNRELKTLKQWDDINGQNYHGREKKVKLIEKWEYWKSWVKKNIKEQSDG